jgi:ribosomal protein RSM22 (predicted rRNA methylase)
MTASSAPALRRAIEAELQGVSLRTLRDASDALSARYREGTFPVRLGALDARQRLAYLTVRMPATFAVASAVLSEVAAEPAASRAGSLLDLGAGLGASLWAAADAWPALEAATLVDADAGMLALASRIWRQHPRAGGVSVGTSASRLDVHGTLPTADLITISYLLGELDDAAVQPLVARAADAARVAVALIEPGTPAGYRRILDARATLLAKGLHLVAPCPHESPCPMTGQDWCHFAARLERSRAHRLLQQGELAWEDEKYSYVAATRAPAAPGEGRILRHPLVGKGRIALHVCTRGGIVESLVTRGHASWRDARRARWGDRWPPAADRRDES